MRAANSLSVVFLCFNKLKILLIILEMCIVCVDNICYNNKNVFMC